MLMQKYSRVVLVVNKVIPNELRRMQDFEHATNDPPGLFLLRACCSLQCFILLPLVKSRVVDAPSTSQGSSFQQTGFTLAVPRSVALRPSTNIQRHYNYSTKTFKFYASTPLQNVGTKNALNTVCVVVSYCFIIKLVRMGSKTRTPV